jgi:hypothetical protein
MTSRRNRNPDAGFDASTGARRVKGSDLRHEACVESNTVARCANPFNRMLRSVRWSSGRRSARPFRRVSLPGPPLLSVSSISGLLRPLRTAPGVLGIALAFMAAPQVRAEQPPASSDSEALVSLGRDLKLQVSEDGPDQPWTVTLANTGNQRIGIIADPGLLWFEVSVSGRPPRVCRLPEPLWPTDMQRRDATILNPKQHFSRTFDPRFFCFSELGQDLLVPGARVTPRFGWPREASAGATKPGRPAADSGASKRRFVAWRPTEPGPSNAPDSATKDSAEPSAALSLPTEGLELIQGPTLELPPSYAAWLGTPHGVYSDVQLVMVAGSDVDEERNAMATFAVVNATDRPQRVFVRRDIVDYEVRGPDGVFECPGDDLGEPDVTSFTTLAPHGAERFAVRLIEMCPRRSFSRPGVYEINVHLDARWSGQELGIDAFSGELESVRSAFVRIRGGDRSPFSRALGPVGLGGSRGAAADDASNKTQEQLDGAPAPEAAPPAPEAPTGAPPAVE